MSLKRQVPPQRKKVAEDKSVKVRLLGCGYIEGKRTEYNRMVVFY